MNKKLWLYASVASIALVGCATTKTESTKPTEQICTGSVCNVDIHITGDCVIDVPDRLRVKLPHSQFKKINWEIKTNGYLFPQNGITIKTTNSGVLTNPDLNGSGKKFTWDNKHEAPGEYEYGINVIKTGPNPNLCSKDPLIVNE